MFHLKMSFQAESFGDSKSSSTYSSQKSFKPELLRSILEQHPLTSRDLTKLEEARIRPSKFVTRTSSMSTGAGISDYLTSPASGVGHKPSSRKTKAEERSLKLKHPDRIIMDGKVKSVVTKFTEEGGIISQVFFHICNKAYSSSLVCF